MIRWKIAQAAELRWWQRYLKNKEPKAYLEWKKSYWSAFLIKCEIDPSEYIQCLDSGCGPAGIFIILDNLQVDALDPLVEKYNSSLDIFDMSAYPNVKFFSSSLENFQTEKQYDLIFCLNAINHVSDWKKSFDTLWQLLKPGATLVLSSDVHRYRLLKPIFRLIPGDILHPQQHSLKDYQKIIHHYKPESYREILIKRSAIFDYYTFVIKK